MTFEAGATLAGGRYVLEQQRGRGGMAVVWRAQDTQLERPVAIKVIAEALAADPDFRRRFEREARAAAAVTHAHVVKLFDYGLEDDQPYLVMEYVDGPNLAELAKQDGLGRLDAEQVAHDLLEAVCHIHRAGVLHRDIKPANLLMTPDGSLRVTDFGIARLDETTQITRTGMVVGTERYLAPEVAAGGPASPASDLYSCGAVLAELVADAPASERLRVLVTALRAADPGARPASAEAALDLLRHGPAAADQTVPLEGGTAGDTAPLGGSVADTAPLAAGTAGDTAPLTPTAETERLGAAGDAPAGGGAGGAAPVHVGTSLPGTAAPVPPPTGGAPTGPTAVLQPGRAGRSRRRASVARDAAGSRGALHLMARRWPLVAALAAAVVVAVLVVAVSGDSAPERAAVPPPAPETAPVGEQLERLEDIVRRIGEHQRP